MSNSHHCIARTYLIQPLFVGLFVCLSVCLFVCLFVNYVGMLLQPVMAGLPGGSQTDRQKTKQTKHKSVQKNNDTIQQNDCNYVLYNTQYRR